ncbi:MAG: ATP-binding protein [Hyphomicrobiaceae bacterium]|nr:ATP-binding protein [Hyphomicrobiaceae bacterium]
MLSGIAEKLERSAAGGWHRLRAAWLALPRYRALAQRRLRRAVTTRRGRVFLTFLLFSALVIAGKLGFGWALLSFLAVAGVMIAMPSEDEILALEAAARDNGDGGPRNATPREQDGWRALIDALPEPAITLDAAGYVMHFNAQIRDLFPNVRTRRPFTHVSRDPELMEAIDRTANARDPIVVDLYERVPLERRVSATITRVSAQSGARGLPAILITFRDQTTTDKLAQMRADFIANASHELRTPLASLRGFVETLQGPAREDPAAREKFLNIMASQAARMTRLIDDLLSLSRVEMKVHLRPTGLVDLNEIAGYVAQTLEPLAEGSSATIEVHPLDTPARIRGDREELVQVLQNLVHNALKYGREGGRVDIRLAREAGKPSRVSVAVTDDGPGIAPEHLPRLTERFYRANVATSREKGGTGLGLAIVKHIVNRHRGDLRIASRVGQGSTFTVLFDAL